MLYNKEVNIAIDVSPLENTKLLSHRVRGTGFYIKNLKSSLLNYFPENKYIFFTGRQELPNDIDLVHYPYFEPFFLSLPFFDKFKTTVTVHDLTPLVFPEHFKVGLKGSLKWQIQKASLKKASTIITDSESSKKDIIKFAGISENKISVVYLAAGEEFKKVESSKLKIENLKKKYGLPKEFVLYVGDVTWNKNLPRLIAAMQKTKIPFVMAGSALVNKEFDRNNHWNQDLVRVQKLIKKDKNIFKLGFVPQEDLVLLYNMAVLFVMPSLYEGFGLPILEAMSCGCPVITTKEGSLKEIAGESAYFVDPYSIESIADGIREIFEDRDQRLELSKKGLIQSKKFTWRRTAEETIRVYESIVGIH